MLIAFNFSKERNKITKLESSTFNNACKAINAFYIFSKQQNFNK